MYKIRTDVDEDGTLWFCKMDVADALDLNDLEPGDEMYRHFPGVEQQQTYINLHAVRRMSLTNHDFTKWLGDNEDWLRASLTLKKLHEKEVTELLRYIKKEIMDVEGEYFYCLRKAQRMLEEHGIKAISMMRGRDNIAFRKLLALYDETHLHCH